MGARIVTVEGFAIVPRAMLADTRLSATELRVYLALAARVNAHMECWPSRKTIAEDAAISLSVAQRALNRLRDLRYIQWEKRARDDGSSTSNIYRLGGITPGVVDDTPPVSPATPPRVKSDTPPVSNPTPLERDTKKKNSSSELRTDVEELLEHLEKRIEGNGSKRPTRGQKARDAMRLLLDKDGRTIEQVHTAIDWCQDDQFWRANILSAATLREKYDTLRLQATREKEPAVRQQPMAPAAPTYPKVVVEDDYNPIFAPPKSREEIEAEMEARRNGTRR